MVLSLLCTGESTGYRIRKRFLSDFQVSISYGTLYPMLHRLKDATLVKMKRTKRQHYFEITGAGLEAAKNSVENLSLILEKLNALASEPA
jgi:DNA-binding PadR family transcriptional regulator